MIREIVNTNDDAFRFISGVRFNTDTVSSMSKSSVYKCVGRTIIELGEIALKM